MLPKKVRSEVSTSRSSAGSTFPGSRRDTEENETDSMRNLAYVVNSANDNITSLQRTVKQQEKELMDRSEQAAALQRNYETLARIRQTDQKEFAQLKAQNEQMQQQLGSAQTELDAARETIDQLEEKLSATAEAQEKLLEFELRLAGVERERDEARAEATQASHSQPCACRVCNTNSSTHAHHMCTPFTTSPSHRRLRTRPSSPPPSPSSPCVPGRRRSSKCRI